MRTKIVILAVICGLITNHVQAETVMLEVTIKAVDAEEHILTVATKTKELKLEVAKKAEIIIGGKASTLKQISPGQSVALSYESMLGVVTKIEVTTASDEQLKQLQGTWKMISEEREGKKKTFNEIKDKEVTLHVTGNLFSLKTTTIEIAGKLNLAKDDVYDAIDFDGKFVVGGKGKSVLLKGIFEVDKETLQLCYTLNIDGGPVYARPTSFVTKAGISAPLSMVFKRSE